MSATAAVDAAPFPSRSYDMLKRLLGLSALVACTVIFTGCDKGSGSNASANQVKKNADDKAAADKRAADDKMAKEKRDAEDKNAKEKKDADERANAEKKTADDKAAMQKKELEQAKTDWAKTFDVKTLDDGVAKLSGDKKSDAQKKVDDFKKLWGDFQKETDGSKLSEWKDKLSKSYDEAKKAAGV